MSGIAGVPRLLWLMKVIATDTAPESPFYNQAVQAGGLIFVSGQGPLDPATN